MIDALKPGTHSVVLGSLVKVLAAAAASLLVASCSNLSTKALSSLAAGSFEGISSASINGTNIVLAWNPIAQVDGAATPTYRVYEGTAFDNAIHQGTETSYSIPLAGKVAGSEWSYGVRAIDATGATDTNTVVKKVVIPQGAAGASSALKFAGLQTSEVTLEPDYSAIKLSWEAATNGSGTVHYVVYGDAAFTKPIGTATTTTFSVPEPTPGSSYPLGVRAVDANGSDLNNSLVVFNVPTLTYTGCDKAINVSPSNNAISFKIPAWASQVNIKRNGTSIHLATDASESPYTDTGAPLNGLSQYQCNAMASSGVEIVGAKVVAATSASNLKFAGLLATGVTLAPDYSAITLSWDVASGAKGTVHYNIYSDANFTTLIGTTTSLTYSLPLPTPGNTYTFAVKARDDIGPDNNSNSVVFNVPPFSYPGCTSATNIAPGNNRLVFTLPAWATQINIFRDNVLIHVATDISESPYTDGSAPVNGSAHYQCSAVANTGATVNGSRIQLATSTASLNFAGITNSGVTLAADYSALTLTWSAATGAVGSVTYKIYSDNTFTTLLGTTASLTYSVPHPTPGTSYTFGVRAQDNTGTDGNTSTAVFSVPALTYSGCTTATFVSSGTNRITFSIPAWAAQVSIKKDGSPLFTATSASDSPYLDTAASLSSANQYLCSAITASGTTVGGSTTLSVSPTLGAAPTLTSISPTAGSINGGTTITLVGTNFSSSATITVAGNACNSFVFVSSTKIKCTTSAHSAATGSVAVTNPDAQTATLASSYTFTSAAPPTVSSVSPNNGPLAGGTAILISGTNFGLNSTANINFVPCTSVVVNSSTSLSCTTPAGSTSGPTGVAVTNGDGQIGAKANAFTYQGTVAVSSIFPSAGALVGGTSVSIVGSGFVVGTTVAIGGVACNSVSVTSWTQLSCITGANTAGAYSVVVTGPNASTATLSNAYTYQAAPLITTLNPASQSDTYSGHSLTIYGANFSSFSQASVGGQACQATNYISQYALTCITPGGSGIADVMVTNPDGQTTTMLQSYSYAPAGWSSINLLAGSRPTQNYIDSATAANVRFRWPQGAVSDGTYLYIADANSAAIRRMRLSTGATDTLIGNINGTASPSSYCYDGYSASLVPGGAGTVSTPSRLAISGDKHTLYMNDFKAVRSYNLQTNFVTTLAGTCNSGNSDSDGIGSAAHFNNLWGITTDDTNIYVTESSSQNVIRQIVISTGATTTIAGQLGVATSVNGTGTAATFNNPNGITTDGTNLYIAGNGGGVIRQMVISTGVVTTLAGNSGSPLNTDGALGTANLYSPADLIYSGGYLYVLSNCCGGVHPLRKIDLTAQTVSTLISNPIYSKTADGPSTTTGYLNSPQGMAINGTDFYFTENSPSNAIRKFDSLTGFISTVAGDITSNIRTDGVGAQAKFQNTVQNIVGDGQNLYTYGSDCTVRQITLSGGVVSTIAGQVNVSGNADGVGTNATLDCGAQGLSIVGNQLYLHGGTRIRRMDLPSGNVTTLAGTLSLGAADGSGTAASLRYPQPGAFLKGSYYFPDYNHIVRKLDPATLQVTTVAGSAGTTGNVDAAGTSARFNQPSGITTDGNYLYVIDQTCTVLRRIDPANGFNVTTLVGVAGSGAYADGLGNTTVSGVPTMGTSVGRFNCVTNMTSDGVNIYLREQNYVTVRKYNIPTNTLSTLIQKGVQESDGPIASNLINIYGIYYTGSKLYLGNQWNIRQVQ